jgi:hypothetical protein
MVKKASSLLSYKAGGIALWLMLIYGINVGNDKGVDKLYGKGNDFGGNTSV